MSDELKTLKVGGFARNILEYVSGDGIEISTDPNDGNKRIVSADGLAIIRIVSNLPATGDADTLYVVPKASGQPGNSRDEFIWVDNQWEKVGDTFVPSNYYTKIETDELISDIGGLEFILVDTLPEEGQEGKIYLVKKTGTTDRDEYVWINGAWELIGDTAVDMSNYYTKTETDNRLNTKVDKVTGKGLSTNDYTTAEKTKLQGIEAGAEVNVQADWNQTDATKDDFIKNKPDLDDFITCDTLSDCRGYFTGVTDTTVNVGDTFDPRSGVSAFDKDDAPIDYVVLPNTVDTSAEGTYQLVYLAGGTDPVIRTVTVVEPVTQAYAYIDTSNNEMHFFRDDENKWTNGQVEGTRTYYTGFETSSSRTWPDSYPTTKVVFEAKISPVATTNWFDGFRSLSSFESIVLLDTSNVTDMSAMFASCSSLTSVDVSGFDTSKVTSMPGMFQNTTQLASVDVSTWDTSSVTGMSKMFYSSGVTTLDLSPLDTSAVTTMKQMFDQCGKLTSLDVSTWDTSSVTDMGSMFSYCSVLPTVDVSAWDTSSVTDMNSMFYVCSAIDNIDVSTWDTSNVTNMNKMFSSCTSLRKLYPTGWDTSNVTDMSYMFSSSSRLWDLDLTSWDTSSVTTMSSMFYGTAINVIDLSSWDTSSVTNMYEMFRGCRSLATIYASPSFVVDQVTSSSDMFYRNDYPLVGGAGTTFNTSNPRNKTYARIDNPPDAPGYFTAKP